MKVYLRGKVGKTVAIYGLFCFTEKGKSFVDVKKNRVLTVYSLYSKYFQKLLRKDFIYLST